jgi:hypothetical protein
MSREKTAFVCFTDRDRDFFDFLRRSLRRHAVIAYERNLYNHLLEKSSRLYNPLHLDKVLAHPDLALVVLSPHSVALHNDWFNYELNALYTLEQFRRTNFIVPIIIGEIPESQIPGYFREQPERIVDFSKSREEGLNDLVARISRLATGKIFIGHGRSRDWKELRDYLQKELNLECDDFEAVPTAGKSIKERLQEMLEEARFAFLVMTAEDEHKDDSRHARENVIHEVGLFQGKLGFERAVILLENNCETFSNISGIIYLPFHPGELEARFLEIKRILEEAGITS